MLPVVVGVQHHGEPQLQVGGGHLVPGVQLLHVHLVAHLVVQYLGLEAGAHRDLEEVSLLAHGRHVPAELAEGDQGGGGDVASLGQDVHRVVGHSVQETKI